MPGLCGGRSEAEGEGRGDEDGYLAHCSCGNSCGIPLFDGSILYEERDGIEGSEGSRCGEVFVR